MEIIVELLLAIILALVVGLGAGYWMRKRSAESQIGSAEAEARRIVTEAEKQIETKKKEATLEAKEEIHRMRQELDRDTKDRRNELSRQERRLVQKEENLDRKIDSLEKKEEVLNRKEAEIDKSQAKIEALHAKQLEELERISGLTTEDARSMLLADAEIEIIDDIKDYVTKNYCDDITVSMFSEKYFVSKEYLSKLFKKKHGCGIYEYALNLRMSRAKELLLDQNMQIQQIAERLGYSNSNYFSKAFKNYYQLSPSEFREKYEIE